MKRFLIYATLLFALCLIASTAFANFARNKEDDSKVVRQIEQQLAEATAQNDAATIDTIESDDYEAYEPNGKGTVKSDAVTSMTSGDIKFQSYAIANVRIRIIGSTAVVTGEAKATYVRKGIESTYDDHYMRIYTRQGRRWQPVALQWGVATR